MCVSFQSKTSLRLYNWHKITKLLNSLQTARNYTNVQWHARVHTKMVKVVKITTKILSQKARPAFKGAVFTCKKVKCPGARAPRVKTTSHLINSI